MENISHCQGYCKIDTYFSVYHRQSIYPAQRSHLVTTSKHTQVSEESEDGDRCPRICVDVDR